MVERGFSPKGHPPVLPVETKRQRVNMLSAISDQGTVRFMERLIHCSKQKVFFLPPYAPEYNPDEYLNHALKISVHSGRLPCTAEDISHKMQSFMR